ncbi:Hillarin [Taenia crassiceps]|uniref:Protein KRI1 homolog n=1 Tax=Taenia crassiceps TaxID=6207 RepID=A0ABR4Q0S9_9CEST
MYGDKPKQTHRQKVHPATSVASEASLHRQKIASLRSNFLTQPLNHLKDVPFTGSSTSSNSINNSIPSDEMLPRSLTPRTRDPYATTLSSNGFPSLQSRLINSAVQPDSCSPSLKPNPPMPSNAPIHPRASYHPRHIVRRSIHTYPNNSTVSQVRDPIKSFHISNLTKSKIFDTQASAWRYPSPRYTDSKCPKIVYETLTSVPASETRIGSRDTNATASYPQPNFGNSVFYHRGVIEPTEQFQSVITLSPSEPLCLYAARQGEYCRSCQRLANSGTSSFHRSSSRHSAKKDSSEESFTARHRRRTKLHNSLPTGYRSVNDLKRRSRRRILASSSSSSSSSSSLDIHGDNAYAALSSDEFWPIAVSKPRGRVCRRRRTRSLNPRRRKAPVSDSLADSAPVDAGDGDDEEEEARAVDALAVRLQPMLAEGRAAEVQTILLKALTRPETRQRALSLLDYLTSEGAIFALQNRSQDQASRKSDTSQNDAITATTSDVSSDLSQTFASRLRLAGAVATNDSGDDEDDDDEKSSEIFGSASTTTAPGDAKTSSTTTTTAVNAATSTIVRVMLPPGGLVEPPPPRLSMPPPKPLPPPTSRSAVVPAAEELARIDDHVLKMLNVNPPLITDLVSQLTKDSSSDVEVVRRLFRWVTAKNFDLIEYDPSAPSDSFVGMLRNVQMGSLSRNELFHELCRFAGVYCQYISGYSKGAGYRPGMSLKQGSLFRNTWLAVYAAGGWRFVNCNWAARYANSTWNSLSPEFAEAPPKCDDFYFFTDPEQHIFEHWPDNKVWQLLHAKPISQARFVSLPVLKSAFFNAGLSLKKPYSQRIVTKNGQVSIKLRMPYFVGISCSLENFADGNFLKGLCLAEVLTKPPNMVRIHCAPSQPGRYYLNIYVSPDWRQDDVRELACSFQVQCCEFNYSRLVVMGRLPDVGFLGRTPAAQHFGVSLLRSNSNRPYILHTSSDPLKVPFFISPGLRLCHQLKSFDRPGHQMTDCDNYALLQMRSSTSFDSSAITSTATTVLSNTLGHSSANAHYHLRLPVNAFYYLTVYAAYEDIGTISTEASDHLECVYRILVDARRPTAPSGSGSVPAFPRQTYWWVGARLLEPTRLSLEVNKRHLFRLDVPIKYASVAVVINASEWHFLKSSPTSSSSSGCARWSGKVIPLVTGELAVYASTAESAASTTESTEGVPYVKLLEYALFQSAIQQPSPTPPQQSQQQPSSDMEFKINEEFVKHYNEYRQKEEFQKLKSRYGDVKLFNAKNKSVNGAKSDENDDDSSSSSSSSESDSEWEEQEHEDFLRLYDALCRGDPALNDEEKVWFRAKPENSEKSTKKENQPVLLKDHARALLLSAEKETNGEKENGVAGKLHAKDLQAQKEDFLAETERLFGESTEGETIFSKRALDSQVDEPKKPLIDTSHFTFQVPEGDGEFLRDYLVNRRWKSAEKKAVQKAPELCVDEMAEVILAAKPQKVFGTDEPLLTAPEELEADDEFLVKARRFEDAWNNNDEELVKEYPQTSATRYRFEEEDKEFIKTYPRKIESTLRQTSKKGMTRAEKRKARAERKAAEKAAKMADIERLKRLKMAEFAEKLERIRKTCGEGIDVDASLAVDFEERGDMPVNEVTKEMIDCLDNDWDPEAHDRLVAKLFGSTYYGAETADDGLDEAPKFESDEEDNGFSLGLDAGNYDGYLPRQHKPVGHNTEIPGGQSSEKQKKKETNEEVETSALARAAKDVEAIMAPRKRGKKAQGRSLLRIALDRQKPIFNSKLYPDFEKYFNEFYQLDCEDIINGSGPGDDVHCRFKYRQVKPNDFGLSIKEILDADEKELNRWVSVKTMSAYRTDEEEERDLRKYHSSRMLQKKASLIPSLVNKQPDQEDGIAKRTEGEKVKSANGEGKQLSKKALKRLRKKQRKAELFSAVAAVEATVKQAVDKPTLNNVTELVASKVEGSHPTKKRKLEPTTPTEVKQKKPYHRRPSSKKPKLSDDRLRAAGIDPKQYNSQRGEETV